MSRKSKRRHRAWKSRRRARNAEDAVYRARNELPPRLRSTPKPGQKPRDGTRWASLSLRGGLKIGFKGTGVPIPVNLDAQGADSALVEATAALLRPEAAQS